jgi:hypothetical protein
VLKASRGARIKTAAEAARQEVEALRSKVGDDSPLGGELERIATRVAELVAVASKPRKAGAA